MTSTVYVPILLAIFNAKYIDGADSVEFTLDEIRDAAITLGIQVRNPADLVYRMRSRTILPTEITDRGFFALEPKGRGRYALTKAESAIISLPIMEPLGTLDLTPLPVRRLLPIEPADFDEQALLTVVGYCKILDHFTGLTNFRLRSHVRRSVTAVGQAELDEISVAIAKSDDERPIIIPIEAKAAADPINRVQICTMTAFCHEHFVGHEARPIAIKVDFSSAIHVVEFNPTTHPADLTVVKYVVYRLNLSDRQHAAILESEQRLL